MTIIGVLSSLLSILYSTTLKLFAVLFTPNSWGSFVWPILGTCVLYEKIRRVVYLRSNCSVVKVRIQLFNDKTIRNVTFREAKPYAWPSDLCYVLSTKGSLVAWEKSNLLALRPPYTGWLATNRLDAETIERFTEILLKHPDSPYAAILGAYEKEMEQGRERMVEVAARNKRAEADRIRRIIDPIERSMSAPGFPVTSYLMGTIEVSPYTDPYSRKQRTVIHLYKLGQGGKSVDGEDVDSNDCILIRNGDLAMFIYGYFWMNLQEIKVLCIYVPKTSTLIRTGSPHSDPGYERGIWEPKMNQRLSECIEIANRKLQEFWSSNDAPYA